MPELELVMTLRVEIAPALEVGEVGAGFRRVIPSMLRHTSKSSVATRHMCRIIEQSGRRLTAASLPRSCRLAKEWCANEATVSRTS